MDPLLLTEVRGPLFLELKIELLVTKGAVCHMPFSVTSHLPRTAQHRKKDGHVPIRVPVENLERVAIACNLFLAFSTMPEI